MTDNKIGKTNGLNLADIINSSPVFTEIPVEVRKKWYSNGKMIATGYEKQVNKLIDQILKYLKYESFCENSESLTKNSYEKVYFDIPLVQNLHRTISNYDINNDLKATFLTYFLKSFKLANESERRKHIADKKAGGIIVPREKKKIIADILKYLTAKEKKYYSLSDAEISDISSALDMSVNTVKDSLRIIGLVNTVVSYEAGIAGEGDDFTPYDEIVSDNSISEKELLAEGDKEVVAVLLETAHLINLINRAVARYYMSLFFSYTIVKFLRDNSTNNGIIKDSQQVEDDCWVSMDAKYVDSLFIQLTETFIQIINNIPKGEIIQNTIAEYTNTSRPNISQHAKKFHELYMVAKMNH